MYHPSSHSDAKKDSRQKSLSKTLTWLLRHAAVQEGLRISEDGYVDVGEILNHKSLRNSWCSEDIVCVVQEDEKKRFTLLQHPESGQLIIKANQGHSIQTVQDNELIPVQYAVDVPVAVHGTYLRHWPYIQKEGLSRMSRLHIHMAAGEPGSAAVLSGARSNCQLFIYIDVAKAMQDGIKFFKSANNVILSPGNSQGYLEPKYFARVIQANPCKYTIFALVWAVTTID